MFITRYIGRTLWVEGDGMMGRVEELSPKVRALFKELGFSDHTMTRLRPDNWVELLESHGAMQVCYRDWVHSRPETKELPVPNSGANIVLVSQDNEGRYYTLVHFRPNGEIGFPGGASVMWCHQDKIVWEDVRLTADREFKEETGMEFDGHLVYLDFTTTTNHYPATATSKAWPDVYAPSMYYGSEVSFHKLQTYGGRPSVEGKTKIIPIDKLGKFQWFNNAAPVFKLLQDMYL